MTSLQSQYNPVSLAARSQAHTPHLCHESHIVYVNTFISDIVLCRRYTVFVFPRSFPFRLSCLLLDLRHVMIVSYTVNQRDYYVFRSIIHIFIDSFELNVSPIARRSGLTEVDKQVDEV